MQAHVCRLRERREQEAAQLLAARREAFTAFWHQAAMAEARARVEVANARLAGLIRIHGRDAGEIEPILAAQLAHLRQLASADLGRVWAAVGQFLPQAAEQYLTAPQWATCLALEPFLPLAPPRFTRWAWVQAQVAAYGCTAPLPVASLPT